MKKDSSIPRQIGLAVLLIAATAAAYGPVSRAGFIWDDDAHISENQALRTAAGLHDIWLKPGATMQHYPLTFTAWWVGYHLWGTNPLGYHMIALMMHIAGSLLLWRVLLLLDVPGAWLAATIFALHPVNVMSVAWATELKNTLSGALALSSCWAYLHFVEDSPRRRRFYALSLVLFLLALLAKTAVGFLPATLLLILWWKRDRVTARDLASIAPMVAMAIATGLITLYVERHSGGATGAEYAVPFVERLLISGRSFWFYLGKFLFPYPLIFIYDRWSIDARQAVPWLYPAATLAFLALLYAWRDRIGKGVFVAAVHFYLGTSALIVIAVLYMTRFSWVSDHWAYFGMWSAAAIAGAGVASFVSRVRTARRAAAIAVVALGVGFLGAATRHQTAQYRNRELLYRATLARNPRCWMASYNLAVTLIGSKRHVEARALLDETLRLKPDHAEAHLDLGNELFAAGEPEAAIEHLNEAKRLVPAYTAKAEFNIADGLSARGDLAGTIEHLRAAVQFDPAFAEAQNNLGYALALSGRFAEAIDHDRQALSIRPDFPEARANLEAARAALHKSCLAAMGAGRTDDAIGCFRQELSIDPNLAEVHNDLGVALAGANMLEEALDQFREAVRLAPESKSARENLERASAAAGTRH